MMSTVPVPYGSDSGEHFASDEKPDGPDDPGGLCDVCNTRIRSEIQQGAAHCVTCSEGS